MRIGRFFKKCGKCKLLLIPSVVLSVLSGLGLYFAGIIATVPVFAIVVATGSLTFLSLHLLMLLGCRYRCCICKCCVPLIAFSSLGLIAASLLALCFALIIPVALALSFVVSFFFWNCVIGLFLLIKCLVNTACAFRDDDYE